MQDVSVTLEKGTVTRSEFFMHLHHDFRSLVLKDSLLKASGQCLGGPAVLFKEKLNYKPPGGAGFLPHLDHPSLAFYSGPVSDFLTVMIAIDDMTSANGCLRVVPGRWDASNALPTVPPSGDPEAGGRAGNIFPEVAAGLAWLDIECRAGDVMFFNGFLPHRSGPNTTGSKRRALFLTFNPLSQGDYRSQYYANLFGLRDQWKAQLRTDYEADLARAQQLFAKPPSAVDYKNMVFSDTEEVEEEQEEPVEIDSDLEFLFE